MTNDSYGDVMARGSFLFRGKHRCRQAAGQTHGVSLGRPDVPERSDRSLSALQSWASPWSVLDCQTTGLDAGLRPIEVAAIDQDGRILIDTLVNPGIRLPASTTALTGIDDAAVSKAPPWRAVWLKLEAILLAQNRIAAWSSEFDLRAMRAECARCDDLAWTTAIDERFVDLAPIVSTFTGSELSFEDACRLASHPRPAVGQQRALRCCWAALQIIRTLGRGGA
jgi:DNA polymerase III epsilon subunit-like protein